MITAGQLQGAMVRTESGKTLGRLREIHLRDGEVTTLTCGSGGLLQRFWPSRRGKTIRWRRVLAFGPREIVVSD